MTATLITYPTAPTARRNPANSRRNTPSRGGAGRAGRHCLYCGAKLGANVNANYCSASHRVSMSRLKRKLADNACQDAFHWQPGEGEALIQRHGLPRMEAVLEMAGWHWEPAQREWVKAKQEAA